MKRMVFLWILLWGFRVTAIQQHLFRQGDQRLMVYQGDTVTVMVDTAYLISHAQAKLINQKLRKLRSAYETNQTLLVIHEEMQEQVLAVEKQLNLLLQRMVNDQQLVSEDLYLILSALDESIVLLQTTNDQLETTNHTLIDQLTHLKKTVKELRQANRRLRWQATRDKIAIALLAFGVGFALGR